MLFVIHPIFGIVFPLNLQVEIPSPNFSISLHLTVFGYFLLSPTQWSFYTFLIIVLMYPILIINAEIYQIWIFTTPQ